jgi:hypothetical protein
MKPSGTLRLLLEPEDDGTAELFVEAEQRGFRGMSSAWIDPRKLADFGRHLQTLFPLPADKPIEIIGGFWQEERIEQVHVRIRVYPIGGAGTVGVQISLATPLHSGERPWSISTVGLELKTHYEQLRTFGRAVEALAKGQAHVAELGPTDA